MGCISALAEFRIVKGKVITLVLNALFSRAQLTLLLRANIPDESSCFLFNRQSYKQIVYAGWGQVVEGRGKQTFFIVMRKARGALPYLAYMGMCH